MNLPGHWQKEIPKTRGSYWTATRDGLMAGLRHVVYDKKGVLLFAGDTDYQWAGWWWSEPVEEPPKPPPWDAP
jgi:hypothetical protein